MTNSVIQIRDIPFGGNLVPIHTFARGVNADERKRMLKDNLHEHYRRVFWTHRFCARPSINERGIYLNEYRQHYGFGPPWFYGSRKGHITSAHYYQNKSYDRTRFVIPPEWYTPDGRWRNSEYEYFGRELITTRRLVK